MESLFNVVFTGELKGGTERDAFIKAFSEQFKCSEAKAAEVLDAGKAVMMKRSVSRDVAEKFQALLEGLGMTIRLEPSQETPEPAPIAAVASPEVSPAGGNSANPYQAPSANLHESHGDGDMTGPVTVPAGHGVNWIGTAWSEHFKLNPLAWIGAFFIFAILSVAVQLIPLLGMFVAALLSPVLTAGMMLGARAQDEGDDFTIGHLFSGFKESTGQLVLVGLFYLIGTIAVFMVAGILMGGSFAMLGMMGAGDPAATEAMAQNPSVMLLPVLVMMMLFIPLLMAYWFAPALVAIDGLSALAAMKLSFIGCIRNVLPFLLYGIVMFVLTIVASIPLLLGLLVLLPVMIASMYTAYRDIYYPEA
jgi:uncharacterized membrane protein